MNGRQQDTALLSAKLAVDIKAILHAALNTRDHIQTAVMSNIAGFAGPRRNGSRPRYNKKAQALAGHKLSARAILQQLAQDLTALSIKLSSGIDQVNILRAHTPQGGN